MYLLTTIDDYACWEVTSGTTGVGPNRAYERVIDFEIPSGVPAGEYYLVLEIDSTGSYAEVEEGDGNIAVYNRRIEILQPPDGCTCTSASPGGAMGLLALLALYRRAGVRAV